MQKDAAVAGGALAQAGAKLVEINQEAFKVAEAVAVAKDEL